MQNEINNQIKEPTQSNNEEVKLEKNIADLSSFSELYMSI